MKPRPILCGVKPCGCLGIVLTVDRDTDAAKIMRVRRTIKQHGYRLEWLSPEEYAARPWECQAHRAVRVRAAREKAGTP